MSYLGVAIEMKRGGLGGGWTIRRPNFFTAGRLAYLGKMAKMKYWGLFPKKEAAEAFAASFSRAGLGVDIRPERGKWAVYTDREKPAPILRGKTGMGFVRKAATKREPLAKIMLGETANAGIPPKTAFPKGRVENA